MSATCNAHKPRFYVSVSHTHSLGVDAVQSMEVKGGFISSRFQPARLNADVDAECVEREQHQREKQHPAASLELESGGVMK